ncbi:hypothetical protein Dimus_020140 [Dionaea muscipula]
MATIQPRRSISSSPGENTAIFTAEVEGEENLYDTQVNERTDFSTQSGNNLGLCVQPELVGVESPTPTLVTRPPGRKASKEKLRTKRQKSQEAHSSIGERVVKSIDDLQAASTAGWQRANQLNEEEQQYAIKFKKLQMTREKIAIEREMIKTEKRFI